ncbi:hypothetical protein BAE44_0011869 [Dichanthelium oligosanthes]|uniref:Uncharacterized protein n=1 Tax=Dichanthelium oligosanthes TaxID=888268 RepID=A0A1E5VPP9_9POAL|nr:hypothetical protein BAE44_0011869 [Dichanthelium oligosanthes]
MVTGGGFSEVDRLPDSPATVLLGRRRVVLDKAVAILQSQGPSGDMPIVSAGDSPLSDPSSEDRNNARKQMRKLEESLIIIALKHLGSSRARDLAALVEQRAYNLRPRKVDPVTLQRRSEFEIRRMHQKQRRKQLAEEEEISISRMCAQIQAMMDRLTKRPRPSDPNAGQENIHTTEVLNAGKSALMNGDTQLFACSGTIIESSEGIGLVVTVANLVKHPDTDEIAEMLKEAVGGPLMDFDGNIIGMNYHDCKETPFIPSFIVSKCLLQLKKSGYVFNYFALLKYIYSLRPRI